MSGNDFAKELFDVCNTSTMSADFDNIKEKVEELLSKMSKNQINKGHEFRGVEGITPFSVVCDRGLLYIMKMFLANSDVKVNKADSLGNTPLHLIASNEFEYDEILSSRITAMFKRADLNKNAVDTKGNTPFHNICRRAAYNIFGEKRESSREICIGMFLARDDLNCNVKNKKGNTALHLACENGNDETVEVLLGSEKIDCNLLNVEGNTALHLACKKGKIETVKVLLGSERIVCNLQNEEGNTALHLACENGNIETVKLLLGSNKIDYNEQNKAEETPCEIAFVKKNKSLIRVFFKKFDENVEKKEFAKVNLKWFLNFGYEDLEYAMHPESSDTKLQALFTSALMNKDIKGREKLSQISFVISFYKQKMEEELEETRRFIDSFNGGTTGRKRYHYKEALENLASFLKDVRFDFKLEENDTYTQLLGQQAQAAPAASLGQVKLRF